MATFTFTLPDIGEGIASAEITRWHVAEGDTISEDQPLADMMTDKATVEIESPVSGRIVQLAGKLGDAVAIGAMLAVIETEGEVETHHTPSASEPTTTRAQDAAPAPTEEAAVVAPEPVKPAPAPAPVAATPELSSHKVLASPAVRARAKALGVDLRQVKGDGPHIRHADLDAFLSYGSAQGYRPQASGAWADEEVPVIGMRRRIAQNMAESKRHIPHFTYVEEVEVTALEEMRGQLNSSHDGQARKRLTLLPFLITALCRALPHHPMLNARYDDEAGVVTRHGRVHLGLATQTPQGLMVPVIRDAQDMNIWQLAQAIADLAQAARDGSIRREDLSGSTFTLSSLGPLAGVASTPVINRPEVAILAPNRIVERPVFADDSDRIRRAKMMNLSISCDHRVVDGHDAASFVAQVKRLIEAPAHLLA
ncbi:dihydrolipoamide acetyltransferase family protein [Novosphingobium terrae]|uniref:dihydrolipoamide acetyltransferase family protein n=1 Tax=Novosphingobium terrae TaxID=2726189 RepID=UPI001980CE74|nr:dihydrolipoamide acetyltransferase family protein [Novosphingobium terrae]